MIPTWHGKVTQTGLLNLDRPQDYAKYVWSLKGQPVELILRKRKLQRSSKANAFYWSAIIPAIADASGMTNDETHTGLKVKFLTVSHDGPLLRVRSTTELSVEEFSAYTEQCQALGSQMFGIEWQ